MTDESAKSPLTVITGGLADIRTPNPELTAESLDLMQIFIKIASAADRRKVIELATRLAKLN